MTSLFLFQVESMADDRKCLFCGKVGDLESELAGRLLFYRSVYRLRVRVGVKNFRQESGNQVYWGSGNVHRRTQTFVFRDKTS